MERPRDQDGSRWSIARRLLAAGVLGGLSILVAASYVPGGPKVCRPDLSSGGSVVEMCRLVGTDDVVMVGLVLLVALLLLSPDLSEFGVAGLLNVKLRQRIAETERRLQATATDVAYLNLAAQSPTGDDLVRAALDTNQRASTRQPSAEDLGAVARILSSERTALEVQLRAVTRRLDLYVAILDAPVGAERATRLRRLVEAEGEPDQPDVMLMRLRRWVADNDAGLREYARFRNAFVHFPDRLSDDEVRGALRLAESLLASAGRHVIRAIDADERKNGNASGSAKPA